MNIAKRRWRQKAIVSLARPMGLIMHRMCKDETGFHFTKDSMSAAI
ncbi:hypothetical protein CEV31_3630 [Brucella thiophenivorans]|uniref:Uncharacterized protein n=1 Tax=Brucella thiophenivorans TaxID=571255 RepID=A0A256FBU1_9HYPH|nr:hypothetical protein CEV31_3630 [Brucella thiophenivorans]